MEKRSLTTQVLVLGVLEGGLGGDGDGSLRPEAEHAEGAEGDVLGRGSVVAGAGPRLPSGRRTLRAGVGRRLPRTVRHELQMVRMAAEGLSNREIVQPPDGHDRPERLAP